MKTFAQCIRAGGSTRPGGTARWGHLPRRPAASPGPHHRIPRQPHPIQPRLLRRGTNCVASRGLSQHLDPRPCESEARPCTPNQSWGHVRPLRTAGASGFPTWISAPGPTSASEHTLIICETGTVALPLGAPMGQVPRRSPGSTREPDARV